MDKIITVRSEINVHYAQQKPYIFFATNNDVLNGDLFTLPSSINISQNDL